MDIHTDIPFDLYFKQSNEVIKPIQYFKNETSISEESYIELIENKELYVTFFSKDKEAKFFFEGLESLPERDVELEDGVAYLPSSSEPVVILKNDYYPLIPGMYLIRVELNSNSYYAMVKIIPNQITNQQWILMKDQVEEHLVGLSQDLIKRKLGVGNHSRNLIPTNQMLQFLIIKKHYALVTPAIIDLNKKANYKIKKIYKMVPIERAKIVDEKSYIHRLRFPENQSEIKAPIHVFNYDLPENRWLKLIVKNIIDFLIEFNTALSHHLEITKIEISSLNSFAIYQESTRNVIKEKKEVLNYLETTYKTSRKMMNTFQILSYSSWYLEVNEHEKSPLPHVMNLDSRYRSIYQLYRELNHENAELKLDPAYALQWKRTDKLYEVWGFIQIINILKEKLDFIPVNGWIYSANFLEKSIIPILSSNTAVEFEKESVKLRLVYDGEIPLVRVETNESTNPIYTTGSNNMPDIRLDIYEENMYMGSLIIDFKYRSKGSIWAKSRINTRAKTTTMTQLISYGISCRSYYLLGGRVGVTHLNPVHEVWAIHPTHKEGYSSMESHEDYHLKLIKMSPSHSNSHIIEAMDSAINNILKIKETFAL